MDPRGSILVVDDEPTITDVVSRYLERAGYSTRIAGDGADALRIAGESRPDLVVLELMLPRVVHPAQDGVDAGDQLGRREGLDHVPSSRSTAAAAAPLARGTAPDSA